MPYIKASTLTDTELYRTSVLMFHRLAAPAFALGLSAVAAVPATADQPVIVELFTSQGCAACPPADALLGELAGRDDVIPLALHVDYWDYIGWSDTFAQAAFTARQHGYGHAAGSSVVYTPQMVVGGVDHVVGNRPMQVADLIAAHAAQSDPVAVEADPTPAGWQVRAVWRGTGSAPDMVVQVVTYIPMQQVEITRGENAGRLAEYHNIVTTWQVVAEWAGARPFEAEIASGGDVPHVVIVQSQDHGAILGAAQLD